jgi:Flp pilus assembly protein TadD, contains TPR repeats
MAPKVSQPVRPRKTRRPIAIALALCALAIAAASPFAWRWIRFPARVQTALPPLPAHHDRPHAFSDALQRATKLTFERRTLLDGVAALGRSYHANGYDDHARACWNLLTREQPRDARWPYLLADLHRRAGDYEAMAAQLTLTIQLAPDYAAARLKLADHLFKTGHIAPAAEHYRQRLEQLPGDPYARLGLARVASHEGRTEEARALIAALVRDLPGFPTAQNLHAEFLAAAGDEDGARWHRWLGREAGRFREADDPWLDELVASCHDPAALLLLATIQYQTGQGDRGRGSMERAHELSSRSPETAEALGDLYLKLGDAPRARAVLERGLHASQTAGQRPSIATFVHLNRALRQLRQHEAALAIADRGLLVHGTSFELHNARGEALDQLGRSTEALQAYQRAVELAPNDAEANFNLGTALLLAGDYDASRRALRQSLASRPTFPKSLKLLSRLELELERIDAAREFVETLYEAEPGDREARALYAEWHLRAGRRASVAADATSAHQLFHRGLAAASREPVVQPELGALQLALGRPADARASLEPFHRLHPTDPHGAFLLGQALAQLGRQDDARPLLRRAAELAAQSGDAALARECQVWLSRL